MKGNPKENINIVALVDEYIKVLNQRCVIHEVPKVYEVSIIDAFTVPTKEQLAKDTKPKKCKRLRLLLSNTSTNERTVLFSIDYVANNPAAFLSAPYKRTLYRDLLFNALGTFAFNTETIIRNRDFDVKVNDPDTFAVETSKTPAEAYPSSKKA